MIDPKRICLFTVIENSKTNIGAGNAWREWDKTNPTSEPLEEEAIECFRSWRKNAGWLKDIDIFCICPSNKIPSMSTINDIKALNVNYIEHYFQETEDFDCGYMNIPLVGEWFEANYCSEDKKYDYIIHIDLDMSILKPIPEEYFQHSMVIGALDDKKPFCYVNEVDNKDYNINVESCFIISDKFSGLYDYWNLCISSVLGYVDHIHEKYNAEIEEYGLDVLCNDLTYMGADLITITHQYQIGERYPIRDDIDINNVLFYHNHKYESSDVLVEYIVLYADNLKSTS